MKQFNLNEYLANPSRKVITRDGKNVRIICTDAKDKYPIIALIKSKDEKEEYPLRYTINGQYCPSYEKQEDLFFAPEKKEGYVNILKVDNCCYLGSSTIFNSKEEAEEAGKSYLNYTTTAKIEWEE